MFPGSIYYTYEQVESKSFAIFHACMEYSLNGVLNH